MATEVITRIIDDLDRVPIPDGEAVRLHFTYDGKDYQLDLSATNAEKFHEQMSFWAERALVIGKSAKKKAPAKVSAKPSKPAAKPAAASGPDGDGQMTTDELSGQQEPQERPKHSRPGIRDWGVENGFLAADSHGRIPYKVEDAYDIAHGLVEGN